MNILVSAIACHPELGSEGGLGWKAVTSLSKHHRLHVMTSALQRVPINHAISTGNYPNLSFTFFGTTAPYHQNRLLARLQSWKRYLDWTHQSLAVALHLTAGRTYDLAHHLTYSSWRVPSPLWRLNVPFVWGPVGGASQYPTHLLWKLSCRSAAFEVARSISNLRSTHSWALRSCVRNSSAVVASNQETLKKLTPLRESSEGMYQLFPTFFTAQQIAKLQFDASCKSGTSPLKIFAGGNIIGSKGLVFALEALAYFSQQSLDWRLVVAGGGPEISFLRKTTFNLKIADKVVFHSGFSGDEYIRQLQEAHLFILPSFRENAGITMLEAMLAGCVPIVMDTSAQGDIVDKKFGFKVPVRSASQITSDIAAALIELAGNPNLRIGMGQMASDYVAQTYREDIYIQGIEGIYDEVRRRSLKAS